MRQKLTPAVVRNARAEPGAERTIYWDEALPGFGLMATANGHKSFVFQYRAGRTSHRMKLDGKFLRLENEREKKSGSKLQRHVPRIRAPFDAARAEAAAVHAAVKSGRDPLKELRDKAAAGANTFKSIAEEYLRREGGMKRDAHGRASFTGDRLRSADQRLAVFERLVYPKLESFPIEEIKRSDVVRLLDKIEDERGPVMADRALAAIRRVFTWHAGRSDEFRSPIVRGMARTSGKERARARVLSDDELRIVWTAADELKTAFGYMLQFILLTGARRNEAARMYRLELGGADWSIPAARFKGKVLAKIPLIGRAANAPVFTLDGKRPIGGFGKAKRKLDERILERLRQHNPEADPLPNWTIHDLRRTARSLMSRAGVEADIAERCLGHALAGVRGTYDRHAYREEKAKAFETLASQIESIVNR
jgi:integrase